MLGSAEGQCFAHLCYLSNLVLAAAHFIFIQKKREGKLRKMEDVMSCREGAGRFHKARPGDSRTRMHAPPGPRAITWIHLTAVIYKLRAS